MKCAGCQGGACAKKTDALPPLDVYMGSEKQGKATSALGQRGCPRACSPYSLDAGGARAAVPVYNVRCGGQTTNTQVFDA